MQKFDWIEPRHINIEEKAINLPMLQLSAKILSQIEDALGPLAM